MSKGKKGPHKSVPLTVNHLVAWCSVSNTPKQKTTSGDQWHGMVSHK